MSGHRQTGRSAAEAETVCPGRNAGRRLCRCRIPARMRLSGLLARQAGVRHPDGTGGIWMRAISAAPDAAAVCPVLRSGGRHSGAELADRQHAASRQRRFLHGCERKSSVIGVSYGVSAGDCCVPGGGPPRCSGRAAGGSDLHRRPFHRADSPVGQRERTARPFRRTAGAGDGAGKPGRYFAGRR